MFSQLHSRMVNANKTIAFQIFTKNTISQLGTESKAGLPKEELNMIGKTSGHFSLLPFLV